MRQATVYLLGLVLVASAVIFVRHLTRPSALARMLTDAASIENLRIAYYDSHSYDRFFVYGDGRLVLQTWPREGVSGDGGVFIPTCTSTVSPQEIEPLVRLIVQKHFVELPQKGFPSYEGPVEVFPWHLHAIEISTKTMYGKGNRKKSKFE